MSELTREQRDQISALKVLPDDEINTADIPEVGDWANAVRGAFHRPGETHVGRAVGVPADTAVQATRLPDEDVELDPATT